MDRTEFSRPRARPIHYRTRQPGTCPRCHSTVIEYDGGEIVGEDYVYYVRCEQCHMQYKEWHRLQFDISVGEEG
jgi:hypothetical protein